MGRRQRRSGRRAGESGARALKDSLPHLGLVPASGPGMESETKQRCDLRARTRAGGAVRCASVRGRRTPGEVTRKDGGQGGCGDGGGRDDMGVAGGDDDNDDDYDDEDLVVSKDEDDDDDENNDVERKCEQEIEEFHDLLKQTTREDVRKIDGCLRRRVAQAPRGLESDAAGKVWETAHKLTSVGRELAEVAKMLHTLGASRSAWGQALMAAEIAGELLRQRMGELQAEAAANRARPRRQRRRVAPQQDGASYLATRLAPLVEETGGRVRKGSDSDAKLVTFFNKELKQMYFDVMLQIRASNAMVKLSLETVFALDGAVDLGAASTEDSEARYDRAVEATYALYPLVEGSGNLVECELPTYQAFRRNVRVFLSVYKEFFLYGEVRHEKVPANAEASSYVAVDDNGFGYRVLGALQRETHQRRFAYWGRELLKRSVTGVDLMRRVRDSKKNRMGLEQWRANQQKARAEATVAARVAKTAAKTAAKAASQKIKRMAEEKREAEAAKSKAKGKVSSKKTAGERKRKRACGMVAERKKDQCRGGRVPGRTKAVRRKGRGGESSGTDSECGSETEGAPAGACGVDDPAAPEPAAAPVDKRQIRSADFDYVLLTEPLGECNYFSCVMMKERGKPREDSMKRELEREDARDHVGQFVTIAAGPGVQYSDISTLTHNLHGKQSEAQRKECRDTAERRGVANLSIPGGSSYLSRDVNVLYYGTAEYERLMGDLDFDVGAVVQGMSQWIEGGDYSRDAVMRRILGRGNLQSTFGISNHNHQKAKGPESGEVANVDVQNESQLHEYFPDAGRELGLALVKLFAVRQALAVERGDGDREYNDELRNQIFSGRVGEMFGLATVGFENVTVALTGCSGTLRWMVKKALAKLRPAERKEAEARFLSGLGIETEDHGDSLNPEDVAYSRVVLGKWRIRLMHDEEGEFMVVTIIGNHRKSVGTYEAKMKGVRGLSAWMKEQVETREAEEGYIPYEADGDLLAHGAVALRIGFVEDEEKCVDSDTVAKYGPGGFVSYSRSLAEEGPWRRHRNSSVQESAAAGGRPGRKRKRASAVVAPAVEDDSLAAEGEIEELERRSMLCGEVLAKRADFDRCADFSGCIWAVEELRDRFRLSKAQARELALCIIWHSRCRAVFLLKCQAILRGPTRWATAFAKAVGEDKAGSVGSFIMSMVNSRLMGRLASELVRATSFHIVWLEDEEGFTPEFVAQQCTALQGLLKACEKLGKTTTTTDFLMKHLGTLRFVGKFVLPQVLPVCYLLGLVNCDPLRAVETPILDKGKKHYKGFEKLGVDRKHFDLTMLVVALELKLVPRTVENTGCEGFRVQLGVLDFMLRGQMFYGQRPVPGCNYREPQFKVYVKKWGPNGQWVAAVRDAQGRWRHPDDQ